MSRTVECSTTNEEIRNGYPIRVLCPATLSTACASCKRIYVAKDGDRRNASCSNGHWRGNGFHNWVDPDHHLAEKALQGGK